MWDPGRAPRAAALAAVVALLAACGGGGDSSSDTTTTTVPASTTTSLDGGSTTTAASVGEGLSACSLMTTTQLSGATGRSFTVVDEQSPRGGTCYFDDGDGINLDFVSILHVGDDLSSSFDGEVESYAEAGTGASASATELPGIGEKAITFDGEYTFVLVGQYVIGIGLDFGFDAPVSDSIETARAIAQIVASNAT